MRIFCRYLYLNSSYSMCVEENSILCDPTFLYHRWRQIYSFFNFRGRIFVKSILCVISFFYIQVQSTKSPKEHVKKYTKIRLAVKRENRTTWIVKTIISTVTLECADYCWYPFRLILDLFSKSRSVPNYNWNCCKNKRKEIALFVIIQSNENLLFICFLSFSSYNEQEPISVNRNIWTRI